MYVFCHWASSMAKALETSELSETREKKNFQKSQSAMWRDRKSTAAEETWDDFHSVMLFSFSASLCAVHGVDAATMNWKLRRILSLSSINNFLFFSTRKYIFELSISGIGEKCLERIMD